MRTPETPAARRTARGRVERRSIRRRSLTWASELALDRRRAAVVGEEVPGAVDLDEAVRPGDVLGRELGGATADRLVGGAPQVQHGHRHRRRVGGAQPGAGRRSSIPVHRGVEGVALGERGEVGVGVGGRHAGVVEHPAQRGAVVGPPPIGQLRRHRAVVLRSLRLLGVEGERAGERGGVGSRQDGERQEAIGVTGGRQPRDLPAPVVADEVEAVGAEDVGEVEHVGDEAVDAVRIDLGRTHARRVAALVRGDGVEAGGPERRDAVAPGVAGLREAVQAGARADRPSARLRRRRTSRPMS